MEILDDDFKRELSAEDEAALRQLDLESAAVLKDIRNGRIALIVLAVFTVIGIGIGNFYINRGSPAMAETNTTYVLIEGSIMLMFYSLSAWFVKSNPKIALSLGFGAYAGQTLLYAVLLPTSFFSGILLKIVLFYFAVKAVIAGFRFEIMREQYRQLFGRELRV